MARSDRLENKLRCAVCMTWIVCRTRRDLDKHMRAEHPAETAAARARAHAIIDGEAKL